MGAARAYTLVTKTPSSGAQYEIVQENDYAELRPVLLQAVIDQGLSETTLGNKTGWGASVVKRLLTTEKKPRAEYVRKLCELLGVEATFSVAGDAYNEYQTRNRQ